MTSIKVTPDQLQALAGAVARGAADIDAALSGLRAQIAPLSSGDWAGPAATHFCGLWEQWQRGARDINESLAGISHLLGRAGQSYAEAESQIAGSFQR